MWSVSTCLRSFGHSCLRVPPWLSSVRLCRLHLCLTCLRPALSTAAPRNRDWVLRLLIAFRLFHQRQKILEKNKPEVPPIILFSVWHGVIFIWHTCSSTLQHQHTGTSQLYTSVTMNSKCTEWRVFAVLLLLFLDLRWEYTVMCSGIWPAASLQCWVTGMYRRACLRILKITFVLYASVNWVFTWSHGYLFVFSCFWILLSFFVMLRKEPRVL